jgi:large subunit ribosomal protein L30
MDEGRKIRVIYFKSKIGAEEYQKQTLRALGLHRLNDEVVRPDNESVRGMIATVRHLVRVEELR